MKASELTIEANRSSFIEEQKYKKPEIKSLSHR